MNRNSFAIGLAAGALLALGTAVAGAQTPRDSAHVKAQKARMDSARTPMEALRRWCRANYRAPLYLRTTCPIALAGPDLQARSAEDSLLIGTSQPPIVTPPPTPTPTPAAAPVASFLVPVCTGFSCAFDARASTGLKISYRWTCGVFPDCTPGNVAQFAFRYPHGGSRTAVLTVTDSVGRTVQMTRTFVVPDTAVTPPPVPPPDTTPPPPVVTPPPDTTTPPPVVTPPPTGGVTPLPAELPRSTPAFTIPAPTRTYMISSGLQQALDTAKAGDEIRLSGTFTGNFVIPTKACGSWITLRSVANAPPLGTRVTPTTAANFARLISPNGQPALKTINPTCGWVISGVAITGTLPVTSIQYHLMALGDGGWIAGGDTQNTLAKMPQNIVVSHVYFYGPALNNTRCIALNSATTIIRDSWIADCHAAGFDSQAINGWNGTGPYLIENNHLEGAGENVMFGGADPGISGVVPSDITIRRNHFIKPLAWRGGPWSIKNLFELKSAARVLVEGNVFENNWPAAQEGMAIVIKSNANGCQCTFLGTRDLTFRYNIVKNAAVGLTLQAADDSYGWTGFIHTQRVRVEHNLFTGIGAEGRASLMMLTHDLKDIAITHNTFLHASGARGLVATIAYAGGAGRRIAINDNVLTATAQYAFWSDNGLHSAALTALAGDGSWQFARNVVGAMDPQYLALNPPASWYPSTVAGIGLAPDFSLAATSPYKGRALGGADPGADIAEVLRRTLGVVVP